MDTKPPIKRESDVIRVSKENGDRPVLFTSNGDRFIHTAADTVAFGALGCGLMNIRKQMVDLCERLQRWCIGRRDKVQSAYLTFAGDYFELVVRQRSETFDEELEEALSELDLEIANDEQFDILEVGVQSVPACDEESLIAFLSGQQVLEINMNA